MGELFMATMDALMVEAVGKPVIKGRRPIPIPSEGEILIKVTTVGCKLHPAPPLPYFNNNISHSKPL